jgi:hypothetical protein
MADGGTRSRFEKTAQIAFWTLASGGLLLLTQALVSVFAQSAAGFVLAMIFPPIVLLVLLLIVAGPAAILIAGVKKRRFAMIAGPLLLIPVIAAYSIGSNWFEVQRLTKDVSELDHRDFTTPVRRHDLIVMGDTRKTDCDDLCQRILAKTDFRVGVSGFAREPVVYARISEAECKATWYVKRNMRFGDICVTVEKFETVDDALVIEIPGTFISGGNYSLDTFMRLPSLEFSGKAYTLIERLPDESDRILGRWVAGEIAVWPFNSGPIGRSFTREEFYAAVLGLQLE